MTAVRVVFDRTALVRSEARQAAARALREIAEDALAEANKTVPLLEGTLQRSGFAEVDDKELQGQVAYDTPYAVIQHEDPHLHHTPPRRDHWLERAVEENRSRYDEHMATALRAAAR